MAADLCLERRQRQGFIVYGAERAQGRKTGLQMIPRTSPWRSSLSRLTQMTLGVGRDSEDLAGLFDEQDAAVKCMIESVVPKAHKAGAKVGLFHTENHGSQPTL
jgi:hypothetical protein